MVRWSANKFLTFSSALLLLLNIGCGGQPTDDIEATDEPSTESPVENALSAFSIAGVRGSTDNNIDAFLSQDSQPEIHWSVSEGATTYSVVIRDIADSSDVCAPQSSESLSQAMAGCSLVDGQTYLVKVVASDGAESSLEAQNSPFTFTVDGSGPVATVDLGPSDPDNSATPSFEFSAIDAVSGIESFLCSTDGAPFVSCSSPLSLSGLTAGAHSFVVKAIDSLGNEGAESAMYHWTIDTTPPGSFSIAGIQGDSSDVTADAFLSESDRKPKVTWTASASANVYRIVIRDDADTTNICPEVELAGTEHLFADCALTEGSSYRIQISAYDVAGNQMSATNNGFGFQVDTQAPPAPTFDVAPGDPDADLTPRFEFSAIDATSGTASFECSLDGGAFAACTSPYTAPSLAPGPHTFKVRATDNLGFVSEESLLHSWDIVASAVIRLTAASDPLDYGNVDLGSNALSIITLTNDGSLTAENIVVALGGDFDFNGAFPGLAGDCGTSLASESSCTIDVRFEPTAAGLRSQEMTVDYDDGFTSYQAAIDIQGSGVSVPADAINNLTVVTALTTEVELSWTAPDDNLTAITDYEVSYREPAGSWSVFADGVSGSTGATVTGLTPSTAYEFRVRSTNGMLSAYSNTATGNTAPDDPFFEPGSYRAINIGAATNSAIVAFEDDTTVSINGTPLGSMMNAGETHSFVSSINDVVEADKPIFVAGRLGSGSATQKGNMVWATASWSGKEFVFSGSRNSPHKVTIYAFESADVTVFSGGVEVASTPDTLDPGGNHTFTLNLNASFKMVSTGLIVAHMYSSGGGSVVDPKPLLPASKEIIGFPSSQARLSAAEDATTYNYYHSNDTTNPAPLNIDAGSTATLSPTGTSSLYQSNALYISADKDIVANSYADANGNCSAPFIPVVTMKKRYGLNVQAEWIAFASQEPGTIVATRPDGSTLDLVLQRSGTDENSPYKVRATNLPAGTLFEAPIRYGAWYEPKTDTDGSNDDETVMFGWD